MVKIWLVVHSPSSNQTQVRQRCRQLLVNSHTSLGVFTSIIRGLGVQGIEIEEVYSIEAWAIDHLRYMTSYRFQSFMIDLVISDLVLKDLFSVSLMKKTFIQSQTFATQLHTVSGSLTS